MAEWLTTKGPRYFGLKRDFVLAWAMENGITLPKRESAQWILERGPRFFGLDWSLDRAFLQELQITGHAAELIAYLDSR